MYVPGDLGNQKKVLNALELEVQMTVSHYLGAETGPSPVQQQVLFSIELAPQIPTGFFSLSYVCLLDLPADASVERGYFCGGMSLSGKVRVSLHSPSEH